jgi:hypothetical protein
MNDILPDPSGPAPVPTTTTRDPSSAVATVPSLAPATADATVPSAVARRSSAELEPDVIDGVVVDEPPPSVPARVVHVASVIVQHEHTRSAGRHLAYVPLGAAVVIQRLWASRSTSRYEKWLRMAEATGDHQSALEWEARLAAFRRDRHQRRLAMITVPADILLNLPKLAPVRGELSPPSLGPEIIAAMTPALPAGSGVQVTGMNELTSAARPSRGLGVLAETLLAGAAALAVLAFVFGSALAPDPVTDGRRGDPRLLPGHLRPDRDH